MWDIGYRGNAKRWESAIAEGVGALTSRSRGMEKSSSA
jgi:hypothetical protein